MKHIIQKREKRREATNRKHPGVLLLDFFFRGGEREREREREREI